MMLINLLYTLVLVLVFVVYNRRREAQIKYPNPDDDVRENIVNYFTEEGQAVMDSGSADNRPENFD